MTSLYLDHAATSFPKPAPVLAAIQRWYTELGVSSARGSSRRCAEVAAIVDRARSGIAGLCGVATPRVAFTSGATESINLFLRAVLRRGDAVVTTAFEHSSVARPLQQLARDLELQVRVVPPDADGGLGVDAVRAAVRAARPRLLVFTHASNVTGAVLDAAAFCAVARDLGALSLLDASQTIGHLPAAVGADAVAASAHKALLGPPGLGFLAVQPSLDLPPQKQGGTGSSAALAEHPTTWPLAFEAGTPNTPAIVGLDAALRYHAEQPPGAALGRALAALQALEDRLRRDPRYRLLAPAGPRVPVLSFTHQDLDAAEVGAILDDHDVQVRTGHHCAPWIHAHLGTALGGTVRVSPGADVSADDILRVSAALAP
ncbi:MAG: aminotransferase class V-fold PLP-dependent enzyme [Planctomycetota bacterium]